MAQSGSKHAHRALPPGGGRYKALLSTPGPLLSLVPESILKALLDLSESFWTGAKREVFRCHGTALGCSDQNAMPCTSSTVFLRPRAALSLPGVRQEARVLRAVSPHAGRRCCTRHSLAVQYGYLPRPRCVYAHHSPVRATKSRAVHNAAEGTLLPTPKLLSQSLAQSLPTVSCSPLGSNQWKRWLTLQTHRDRAAAVTSGTTQAAWRGATRARWAPAAPGSAVELSCTLPSLRFELHAGSSVCGC